MGRRVTLVDVARRVGVTQPTVSAVFGAKTGTKVSAELREKILEAAQEMEKAGLRPHPVFREDIQAVGSMEYPRHRATLEVIDRLKTPPPSSPARRARWFLFFMPAH